MISLATAARGGAFFNLPWAGVWIAELGGYYWDLAPDGKRGDSGAARSAQAGARGGVRHPQPEGLRQACWLRGKAEGRWPPQ